MAAGAFDPVGIAVFGDSTPFAYWGFHAVREIVEAIAGQTVALHIATLPQLRDGFSGRAGASVVMTSDLPDADLASFVCTSGLPLIVFSEDPDCVLDWTMQSRALACDVAARLCSRIYSALEPTVLATRKLTIARARNEPPERIVATIIEYLWPGRGDWLATRTYEYLLEAGRLAPFHAAPTPSAVVLDAPLRDMMRDALAGYCGLMTSQGPQEIVWPLPLFTRPDGLSWRDPIELTGPARAVLFGPYMHLPVGAWTARVEFEIDGAVSGAEALTDVRINEVVLEKTFGMPAKGIFAYELGFRVADPHHPVEIRLFIKQSAIEGVFLPRSVRVRFVAA